MEYVIYVIVLDINDMLMYVIVRSYSKDLFVFIEIFFVKCFYDG